MTQVLTRHIVLIGMMGAGKTAIGSELARRLRVPFTDSDAEIEAAAAMSISEIFARDGEAFFRAREAQVLSRLLAGAPGVVSTGGGAWMRPENRQIIGERGLSVWLNCSPETLWARVRQRPTRPLLQTADPKGTLLRLLAERSPVYALADLEFVSRAGDTIEATATRLIAELTAAHPTLTQEKP
ncbi:MULTISPECIES: shikimate kinase [Paracoccus]|jgi:shikimate kinase|nr:MULTISPECIES: shikimate kinase [Paracoccus]QXI64211.1 Shikimate kinase [Paracoccus marcusii]WDA11898.1 shikimate kinase [Paracoccus marcusii]|tara:strand:- start:2238 stop:2789 length:552 start_codon:yes stop_codon:yes gene_type:complete